MTEEQADPRIGMILQERYRVLERVAAGGMGVVYRGERLQLGRAVAIKFMHPWIAEQPSVLKRFSIEAQAMSRLQHPACISVIDFGVDDGAPYLVMDYVTGRTLKSLLGDGGPLAPALALEIARQVLSALAHAHAKEIIHRDIKPENVVLADLGGLGCHIRVLDFGLAKLRDANTTLSAGLAIGTPSYMAPEQTCGDPVDARTDLYAVGVLLYELLTGHRPFVSDRIAEVMAMQREQPPASLRVHQPTLSPELNAAVMKALAKKPADRYASAVEFVAALDATPEARATPVPLPPAPLPAAETSGGPDATAATVVAVARRAAVELSVKQSPSGQALPGSLAKSLAILQTWTRRMGKRRTTLVAAGAVGVLLLGGLALKVGHRGKQPPPARQPVAVSVPVAPSRAAVADEDAPGMDEVQALVKARRIEAAIKQLDGMQRRQPDNAYLPYLDGTLCMTQLWWSEGLDAYARALALRPAYAQEPELIRNVVHALISDRQHRRAAELLEEKVGKAAIPFLREASEKDDSQRLRQRAAALLQRLQ